MRSFEFEVRPVYADFCHLVVICNEELNKASSYSGHPVSSCWVSPDGLSTCAVRRKDLEVLKLNPVAWSRFQLFGHVINVSIRKRLLKFLEVTESSSTYI